MVERAANPKSTQNQSALTNKIREQTGKIYFRLDYVSTFSPALHIVTQGPGSCVQQGRAPPPPTHTTTVHAFIFNARRDQRGLFPLADARRTVHAHAIIWRYLQATLCTRTRLSGSSMSRNRSEQVRGLPLDFYYTEDANHQNNHRPRSNGCQTTPKTPWQ